jgi:hypothetical protein
MFNFFKTKVEYPEDWSERNQKWMNEYLKDPKKYVGLLEHAMERNYNKKHLPRPSSKTQKAVSVGRLLRLREDTNIAAEKRLKQKEEERKQQEEERKRVEEKRKQEKEELQKKLKEMGLEDNIFTRIQLVYGYETTDDVYKDLEYQLEFIRQFGIVDEKDKKNFLTYIDDFAKSEFFRPDPKGKLKEQEDMIQKKLKEKGMDYDFEGRLVILYGYNSVDDLIKDLEIQRRRWRLYSGKYHDYMPLDEFSQTTYFKPNPTFQKNGGKLYTLNDRYNIGSDFYSFNNDKNYVLSLSGIDPEKHYSIFFGGATRRNRKSSKKTRSRRKN